jgi:bifunctional UDP-N-acetylglucosamine pyrophosphorylase / glucosamine-1-phosphate N-acetyltransferase
MALASVILAAGQGTRMKSQRAKVLHELAGEPMVHHPIRLALGAGASPVVLVIGHQADEVKATLAPVFGAQLGFALQSEQKGTGHAVMQAMPALEGFEGRVLILYGDVPLLRAETVRALSGVLDETKGPLALITTRLPQPKGYGRIVRDANHRFTKIVEEKDADEATKKITEVNAGIYSVESKFLRAALSRLGNDNAQKEYYLTDLVAIAKADGHDVGTLLVEDPTEVKGANTQIELAELASTLRRRINERHMIAGVTMIAPEVTYVGAEVEIGEGTVLAPNVHLYGKTKIGKGCTIDTGTVIKDGLVGDKVTIKPYTVIEEGRADQGAILGPFSRLRPAAHVMEDAHVGNFVELKKTKLGKGAKANHLAYLGDAEIGDKTNVGAGTITCNYDGYGKYLTKIGSDVFVGSNSTLVAPVEIGDQAYVAAGSVITDAIGKQDLAFGRARQVNKVGRAEALRAEAKEQAQKAKGKKG